MSRGIDTQRTILVTGAASGIGLALVRRLWASDYRVVVTARAPAMDRWEGEPFDDNDRFMLRAMDVTSATDRQAVVAGTRWLDYSLQHYLDRR